MGAGFSSARPGGMGNLTTSRSPVRRMGNLPIPLSLQPQRPTQRRVRPRLTPPPVHLQPLHHIGGQIQRHPPLALRVGQGGISLPCFSRMATRSGTSAVGRDRAKSSSVHSGFSSSGSSAAIKKASFHRHGREVELDPVCAPSPPRPLIGPPQTYNPQSALRGVTAMTCNCPSIMPTAAIEPSP